MHAYPTVHLYDKRQIEIDVDYASCILPCSVQTTDGKNLIHPPYVRWEHLHVYELRLSYIPVADATLWERYGLFFTNYPNYCKLRGGSIGGVYDCDLHIRPCPRRYMGVYKCTVYDFFGGSNTTSIVSFLNNFDITCVLPDILLNCPQLLSSADSPSVNFSWTPLERENNVTVCHHTFSVRIHQLSVPYDFEDNTAPPHASGRYENVDQQTNYIFNNINRDTYYLFELRVQSPPRSNRYYSYVHYFGDQVPARVTNPVQGHTVIRVTEGDPVTVPCEGTGIPSPSVRLLREVTSVPLVRNGCPNFIPAVSEQDAGEYFCVADNTLVSRGS